MSATPQRLYLQLRALLSFRMSLHESSLPSWATSSQTNVISFLLLGSQVQSPKGLVTSSPSPSLLCPTSASLWMHRRFLLPQPELAQAGLISALLTQVSLPPLWSPPPVHPPSGIQ